MEHRLDKMPVTALPFLNNLLLPLPQLTGDDNHHFTSVTLYFTHQFSKEFLNWSQ